MVASRTRNRRGDDPLGEPIKRCCSGDHHLDRIAVGRRITHHPTPSDPITAHLKLRLHQHQRFCIRTVKQAT